MSDMLRDQRPPEDPVMSLVLGMLRETRDDVKAIREQMNSADITSAERHGGFTVRLDTLEDRHRATRNMTYAIIIGVIVAYFREMLRGIHG